MDRLPRDWEESDILALIDNQVKESISLEYKSAGAIVRTNTRRNDDVSKDVSSFANSAGGTIVYGVREDVNLPIEIDGGLDPGLVSREWLEQVINSTIQQRIDGVRINQVELVTTFPGKVLYVVEIPQAIARAPHQASDHKYYKRFEFNSVPMEDYEIRDVMLRSVGPDLYCTLQFNSGDRQSLVYHGFPEGRQGRELSEPVNLHIKIGNRAVEPAAHAVIHVHIDHRIELFNHPFHDPVGQLHADQSFQDGGVRATVTTGITYWPRHVELPIFRGFEHAIAEDPIELQFPWVFPNRPEDYVVATTVIAPRMEPKTDIFAMTDDHHAVTIRPAEGWIL